MRGLDLGLDKMSKRVTKDDLCVFGMRYGDALKIGQTWQEIIFGS